MKRNFLLCLALLLLLTACGAETAEEPLRETDWTAAQMARAVWQGGSSLEGTELLPGDEGYDTYLTAGYGLDPADIADGAIRAAGGTSAQEAAVFLLTEATDPEEAAETLRAYLEHRTGAFTGYLLEEAALLENAEVEVRGRYVALMACEDLAGAREAFARCFIEAPPAEETGRLWADPPRPGGGDGTGPGAAPDQ